MLVCLLCVLLFAVVDFLPVVADLVPLVAPVWPRVVVPVVLVEPPVPNTELLSAMPGEFCTCEIALALACVGPCELARAAVLCVWPLLVSPDVSSVPAVVPDVPPLTPLVPRPAVPVPVVVPPFPRTELLFAAPGEFCT